MNAEDEGFGFLDLMLLLAENLKLLIFGPVVAGLVTFGVGFNLPPSYVSKAILIMPISVQAQAQAQAMMSPLVLDPVIEALELAKDYPIEAVRRKLMGQMKIVVGKDGVLRLDVTAPVPELAQTLCNAVIESWLKSMVPIGQDRVVLQQRLDYAKESLDVTRRLFDRLIVESGKDANKSSIRGEIGASIVAASELQMRYLTEIRDVSGRLQILSHDFVKQSPTFPVAPDDSKKILITVLATLVTGLSLLLWILVRRAWVKAGQDLLLAEKQARLRVALGFKK